MRGGSHGDWNRFLCSQILGAERDTMLPGGRHPFRFVFQSDQDYSGRDAPWRRCCCGGGEPWDCARRAGRHGDPTGDYGPEAVDAFGALWGECAAARYVRVRRPGNRPAGDAGTESVRREGRACHGTRPPGPGSTLRTGRRRGDGGRSRAGKLLAAPIRGRRGFTLSDPGQASSRSGEPRPRGLHSLSRLATTGTVDPGAGCAIEARRGGPLLALEGPEADSAFEALGNALAEGPRILWPKGAPLSPSRHHPTWLSDRAVRWGQEGMLAVACTTVCKLTLFNRFGAGAGGQVLWQDHRVRPPSICIYGIRFGWVLLSGGFCSREPILYLVQGVHQ